MHRSLKAFTGNLKSLSRYGVEEDENTLSSLGMDYVKYVRSDRARRISLRLDNKERVFVLTVPKRCSLKKAEKFALQHEDWMLDKLDDLPEHVPFRHGEIVPILGYNREIQVFYNKALKATDIVLKRNRLTVYTNREDPTSRIQRFLKKLAKETMEELAYEKAEELGKKINKITVRDTKTRWGSCSSEGNISLSWRLIFAPYEAMDYVVGHEVAHLKHLDHSDAFWAQCRALCDDFVEGQYWMDNHGHELMRFG